MTGSAFRAAAPVSAVTRQKPQNRTLRRRAGVLRKQQTQKKQACRRLSAEERAASGEAGEKTWRFSAPACPRLPAVRAVLSGKNGAFLWVGKVDWRYFSGKAKIVPLLQA